MADPTAPPDQSAVDAQPSSVLAPDEEARIALRGSFAGAGRIIALFAEARTPVEQAVAHQAMVRALATWVASAPAPRDAALLDLSHRSLDGLYKEISGLKAMLAGEGPTKEPTDG